MGNDWTNKCERTLYLAKNLGNIYTGSLYNGLLSLMNSGLPVEQGGEGLDLRGRRVMLFSYGSGCAASMFMIRVSNDGWAYRQVLSKSSFKQRLESRIKLSPEDFDRWMSQKEQNYGKAPYNPNVRLGHIFIIYRGVSTTCTMAHTT
jgi:hydroxymethylglutaryl-CoA synthase